MEKLKKDTNGFYILDDRTKNYFDAIKNNMGYVNNNDSWYGIEEILIKKEIPYTDFEKVAEYEGYANSSEIRVYTYTIAGDKKYCAELSYQTAIDDYNIETHVFMKLPTRQDVLTVRDIRKVTLDIEIGKLRPIFSCWECGREVHWLDNKEDLETKIERLKDQYCGC